MNPIAKALNRIEVYETALNHWRGKANQQVIEQLEACLARSREVLRALLEQAVIEATE